jgi:catechol 2,3-dioxygenase-like lactoylglutathione lyase family enzyme
MLTWCEIIAFVPTARPEEAKEFCQGTLGLRLVSDDPAALVFDANGVMLRVAKVKTLTQVPYTVLGWKVKDAASCVRELQAKGVMTLRYEGMKQDDLGVWTSPSGAKIAWFRDPDGNTLSVTQF